MCCSSPLSFPGHCSTSGYKYQDFLFDEWKRRIDSYARNGYESYTLRYANHMSFSDFSLMMPFGFITAPHREEHHRLTTHLVLDFFNRKFKGAGAAEAPEEYRIYGLPF